MFSVESSRPQQISLIFDKLFLAPASSAGPIMLPILAAHPQRQAHQACISATTPRNSIFMFATVLLLYAVFSLRLLPRHSGSSARDWQQPVTQQRQQLSSISSWHGQVQDYGERPAGNRHMLLEPLAIQEADASMFEIFYQQRKWQQFWTSKAAQGMSAALLGCVTFVVHHMLTLKCAELRVRTHRASCATMDVRSQPPHLPPLPGVQMYNSAAPLPSKI